MPKAAEGEIIVKNAAVAINPLDCHMQDAGVFVQQWPTVFGCDVAGEVYEVGSSVDRFKKGDRVIGSVSRRAVSLADTDGAPTSAIASTWLPVALQMALTLCTRSSPPTRRLSFLITSPSPTASWCPSPLRRPLVRCPLRSLARACLAFPFQPSVSPIPPYRPLLPLRARPSSCTALPLLSAP